MTKVSELEGSELDYWVAKAIGYKDIPNCWSDENDTHIQKERWKPSTNWQQGGELIEKYRVNIHYYTNSDGCSAECIDVNGRFTYPQLTGLTPLIAAMRCIVASKCGEEVDAKSS